MEGNKPDTPLDLIILSYLCAYKTDKFYAKPFKTQCAIFQEQMDFENI